MELVAQGVGNAASAMFGGASPPREPSARTAANIKNGGNSPVAGMVHAVVLMLVLVLLMPYAALIPMPCIAGQPVQVAYNMSGWRTVVKVVKTSPKSDVAVLVLTFFLTVVFDLVVAIAVGLTLACLLFMKRMADVAVVQEWEYVEDTQDDQGRYKPVPAHVMVYEVTGPMFFGAADKIPHMDRETDKSVLVLRMRAVPRPGHHGPERPAPPVGGVPPPGHPGGVLPRERAAHVRVPEVRSAGRGGPGELPAQHRRRIRSRRPAGRRGEIKPRKT